MKIEFKDVCQFIIDNSDNIELMDKLNKITFPFTTKYISIYEKDFIIKDKKEKSFI